MLLRKGIDHISSIIFSRILNEGVQMRIKIRIFLSVILGRNATAKLIRLEMVNGGIFGHIAGKNCLTLRGLESRRLEEMGFLNF